MKLPELLKMAGERQASDLHIVAGYAPQIRVHGYLETMTDIPPLTNDEINGALAELIDAAQMDDFKARLELDFGCSVAGVGRVRGNAARQQSSTSLVFRLLPAEIPTIEGLGLPDICRELVMKRRGLVVVSGPTGSGKSTTLAAMIDYLNQTEKRRLVTIEDPVEYVYRGSLCTITQRELGGDTKSFAEALRHVLRQDPDVILVGEMRDLETAAAALAVAETGHLVLTTGHAPSASQAVDRIMDLFPPHERHLAQTQLASLLAGVLCQTLVPKHDGAGRVAAIEIMLANGAVRNLIREGKIFQLPNTIRMNTQGGMQLMDQALVSLCRSGEISKENVFSFCHDREEVEKLMGTSGQPNFSRQFSAPSFQ